MNACTSKPFPTPHKESERLRALARYDIMDSLPEADYDAITALAHDLLGAKFSLISFVDEERVWFKSCVGLDVVEIPRDRSLCALVLDDTDEFYQVHDISQDTRTCALLIGDDINAYIGAPLRAHTGERIGVISLAFSEARVFTQRDLRALNTMRRQVEMMLEQRRTLTMVRHQQQALTHLAAQHSKLLSTVSHDTRNLLAGILSNCEFAISQIDHHTDEAREAIEDALTAAQHAKHMLYQIEDSRTRFREQESLRSEAMTAAF